MRSEKVLLQCFVSSSFFVNGLENKFLFSTWNKMLIKFIASAFNLPIYFFSTSTLCKHVKINEFVDLSNRPFAFIFSCFLFLIRSIRPKTRQAKKSLKNCFFFSSALRNIKTIFPVICYFELQRWM